MSYPSPVFWQKVAVFGMKGFRVQLKFFADSRMHKGENLFCNWWLKGAVVLTPLFFEIARRGIMEKIYTSAGVIVQKPGD